MRPWPALIGTLLFASCETAPLDCEQVKEDIFACFDKQDFSRANSTEIYEECVPLGEPEKISGTWFYGFEYNLFFEGRDISPDNLQNEVDPRTSLLIEETPLDDLTGNGEESFAIDLTFIGRRELCDPIAPDYQIQVDKVEAAKIIRREPSNFYYPNDPKD